MCDVRSKGCAFSAEKKPICKREGYTIKKMTRRLLFVLRLALGMLLLGGCGALPAPAAQATPLAASPSAPPSLTPFRAASATPTAAATATFTPPPLTATPTLTSTPVARVSRVLIMSFDGLRPDAIAQAPMPKLGALMKAGAYTLVAQTIFPSVTLPSHTSMLLGTCPSQHGVNWNDYLPENGYAKGTSVFALAKQAGLYTVFITGKKKLRQITPPDTTDYFQFINDNDTVVAKDAAPILKKGFDLAFIHFATIDEMGHNNGWLSPQQLNVIRHADEALATVLEALDQAGLRESTLIIVTADHGGHKQTHGTRMPEDMTIPWIVNGPGVVAHPLTAPVSTTDTAATAAWALGLTPPSDWVGRPVTEAFGLIPTARAEPRCP